MSEYSPRGLAAIAINHEPIGARLELVVCPGVRKSSENYGLPFIITLFGIRERPHNIHPNNLHPNNGISGSGDHHEIEPWISTMLRTFYKNRISEFIDESCILWVIYIVNLSQQILKYCSFLVCNSK